MDRSHLTPGGRRHGIRRHNIRACLLFLSLASRVVVGKALHLWASISSYALWAVCQPEMNLGNERPSLGIKAIPTSPVILFLLTWFLPFSLYSQRIKKMWTLRLSGMGLDTAQEQEDLAAVGFACPSLRV